jgi:ribosomal protein L29
MKGNLEELTLEEIQNTISDIRKDMRQERFKRVTGKPENTKFIREAKRKIARLLTVKRERELDIRIENK